MADLDSWPVYLPKALLGVLIAQTLGAIWWAATLSTEVKKITESVAEMRVDRYTRAEAALALRDIDNRNLEFARRVAIIEETIRETRRSYPEQVYRAVPKVPLPRVHEQERGG